MNKMNPNFALFIKDNLDKSEKQRRFFTNYKDLFENALEWEFVEILESIGNTELSSEKVKALFERVNELVDTAVKEIGVSVTEVEKNDIKYSLIFYLCWRYINDNPSKKSLQENKLLAKQLTVLTNVAHKYFMENGKEIHDNIRLFYESKYQEVLKLINSNSGSTDDELKELLKGNANYLMLSPSYTRRIIEELIPELRHSKEFTKLERLIALIETTKFDLSSIKHSHEVKDNPLIIKKAIEEMEELKKVLATCAVQLKNNPTSLSDANRLINSAALTLAEITKCSNVDELTPMLDDEISSNEKDFHEKYYLQLSGKCKKQFAELDDRLLTLTAHIVTAIEVLRESLIPDTSQPTRSEIDGEIVQMEVQKNALEAMRSPDGKEKSGSVILTKEAEELFDSTAKKLQIIIEVNNIEKDKIETKIPRLYYDKIFEKALKEALTEALKEIYSTKSSNQDGLKQRLEKNLNYITLPQTYKDRLSDTYSLSLLMALILKAIDELNALKTNCENPDRSTLIVIAIAEMESLVGNLEASIQSLRRAEGGLSVSFFTTLINLAVSSLQERTNQILEIPGQDLHVISWGEKFLNALAWFFTLGKGRHESGKTKQAIIEVEKTASMQSSMQSLKDSLLSMKSEGSAVSLPTQQAPVIKAG